MSSRSHTPDSRWPERDDGQRHSDATTTQSQGTGPKLTRIQIEALVSGDFAPLRLGPELVQRLNHAWSGAGQHLHMLHVEVVNTPLTCPRCGDHALYRKDRRGFLQRKVLSIFGLFPWKCVSCRKSTLLRRRNAGDAGSGVLPKGEIHETRRAA